MLKKTLLATSIILASSAFAQTEAPNTFTSGTAISAAEMNANFDAMEAGINANTTAATTNASDISTVTTSINNLNSTVSSLQQAVSNLQTQVDGMSSGSGSFDLPSYVGSGVYQMFFKEQNVSGNYDETCSGMTTLVFNSGGTLEDGVVDDKGTPDMADDVIMSGTAGSAFCVEKSGSTASVYRDVWADVGATWSISGQNITLTFMEQMVDSQDRDLYTDGSNDIYGEWGASNNANPSQFYSNIWDDYIALNGYHGEFTSNGDDTGTIEIWATYDDFVNSQPPMETWTDKEHFFYSSDDTRYTGSVASLQEKEGPESEVFKVTADGNMIVKQKTDAGQDYHDSELIIGIRVGSSAP